MRQTSVQNRFFFSGVYSIPLRLCHANAFNSVTLSASTSHGRAAGLMVVIGELLGAMEVSTIKQQTLDQLLDWVYFNSLNIHE